MTYKPQQHGTKLLEAGNILQKEEVANGFTKTVIEYNGETFVIIHKDKYIRSIKKLYRAYMSYKIHKNSELAKKIEDREKISNPEYVFDPEQTFVKEDIFYFDLMYIKDEDIKPYILNDLRWIAGGEDWSKNIHSLNLKIE